MYCSSSNFPCLVDACRRIRGRRNHCCLCRWVALGSRESTGPFALVLLNYEHTPCNAVNHSLPNTSVYSFTQAASEAIDLAEPTPMCHPSSDTLRLLVGAATQGWMPLVSETSKYFANYFVQDQIRIHVSIACKSLWYKFLALYISVFVIKFLRPSVMINTWKIKINRDVQYRKSKMNTVFVLCRWVLKLVCGLSVCVAHFQRKHEASQGNQAAPFPSNFCKYSFAQSYYYTGLFNFWDGLLCSISFWKYLLTVNFKV